MKKTLFLFTLLLAPLAAFADSANKMTMVTYFPVPYVAYSQVDVTKQMDIGLTSACQMNLGCTADEGFSTGKSLRVNTALNIAGGKLDLNDAPAIAGATALIGSGNGVADFDFDTNLRVANYKQGYTMQADNMYLSELNLFGYKFPACSGETMSWQKLKLKNKDEVYLVCGAAEKGSCEPPADEPTSEPCDSPATGTKTRTWNYDTCQWNAWNLFGCTLPDPDIKKTYVWVVTDEGETNKPATGTNVWVNCYLTYTDTRNGFASGGKLIQEIAAGVIYGEDKISRGCNSDGVGYKCKIGMIEVPQPVGTSKYYYPTYTCTEK